MRYRVFTILLVSWNGLIFGQSPHLDVEGHTKMRGNIDLSHMEDTSSMFVGRNARINYPNAQERRNTIVGVHSVVNPQSGNNAGLDNSLFGYDAGRANMGGKNSFFGTMAGSHNRGFSNAFYGYSSGVNNTFGSSNSFFGHRTGFNNDHGSNNVFVGSQAGAGNRAGQQNTFLGSNAGAKNEKGSRNTFIGAQADQLKNADSLDRATAIGFNARAECSQCAILGGTGVDAVKVGIGVTDPDATLHIKEDDNTRLKISNSNSKAIYFDLIRNEGNDSDVDWRIENSISGKLLIGYHKTNLDGNAPTTLISANTESMSPGSANIELGLSAKRWKKVWAKTAQFSELLLLEPLSKAPTCAVANEGSIYYDKVDHKLKICTMVSTNHKWVDLH